MKDFWTPQYKWQLVEWFKKNRPSYKVSSWSKSKLYAVYFKEREAFNKKWETS